MAKKTTSPKKASKKPIVKLSHTSRTSLFKASGVTGEGLFTSFRNEEKRQDNMKLEDYRKMMNDSTVNMLWTSIVTTIMGAGFEVVEDPEIEAEINKQEQDARSLEENPVGEEEEPDKETEEESDEIDEEETEVDTPEAMEASEEKLFIEKALFTPEANGGMETSFDLVTKTMLRAFIEGYRLFELVYKKVDNEVLLKKVAPRSGRTDQEIHVHVDDDGDFNGFTQRTLFKDKYIDIEVVNTSDILKVVKATFGQEFGSLYGRSGFKAASYDWQMARKGMYLNHVGHELGSVKLRKLSVTGAMSEEDKDKLITSATKLGVETVWLSDPEQVDLEFMDVSDAGVMEVGLKGVNMHLSRIAKSILAQFADLGSSTSETGSRALGETQTSFFKQGLESVARTLIEDTWNDIIASLMIANFNNGVFPRLKTNPIADEATELLLTTFTELVKKGNISESVKKEIQAMASEELGLDVTDEDIERELQEDAIKEEEQSKMEAENAMDLAKVKIPQIPVKASEVKLQDDVASDSAVVQRPLFPDEEKVKLVDIKRKMDTVENSLEITLRRKLAIQRDEMTDLYVKAIREGRKSIQRVPVKLQEQFKYSDELLIASRELTEFGKITAANELDTSVPSTTRSESDAIEDNVDLIVEDQEARLRTRMVGTANTMLAANVPENEAKIRLENVYDNFFRTVLIPTVGLLVNTSINNGRSITFKKNEKQIFAFRYTAILDDRTCFIKGTKVLTDKGYQNIEDVKEGTNVLTQEGFKPVVATLEKDYDREIYEIVSGKNKVQCTWNHPFLTQRGWIEAKELRIGDNLINFNSNIFTKIFGLLDKNFFNTQDTESIFREKGSFAFISPFISVPISTINLYTQSEFRDKKVNRISPDLGFLNKIKTKFFKFFSNRGFNAGLTSILSVARNTTKTPRVRRFLRFISTNAFISNLFTTLKAVKMYRWAKSALTRTMNSFLVLVSISEDLIARLARHIDYLLTLALHRAEVISIGIRTWYGELPFTSNTNLEYSFIGIPASHRAVDSSTFSEVISRNVKDFVTRFTMFINTSFSHNDQSMINLGNYINNGGVMKVYDLTIQGKHEYLANNILVHNTDFCASLDGQVFQDNDPDFAMLEPPNHFNCRSIWTSVTKDEATEFDIEVTGKPTEDFPVFSNISTFKDAVSVFDLMEKRDKEVQLKEREKIAKERAEEKNKEKELNALINLYDAKRD